MTKPILIRGGGDLASGVVLRLHHAGYPVIVSELHKPLSVRRAVSFSEAVYEWEWSVEDVHAQRVDTAKEAFTLAGSGTVPVLVDPDLATVKLNDFEAVIDARLLKTPVQYSLSPTPLIIGLGPGFTAGKNCHAVIETMRGHTLGRVYWSGCSLSDNGQPEGDPRRVLRAPIDGVIESQVEIGQHVKAGDVVAVVGDQPVTSQLTGVVRGLIHTGLEVSAKLKIGDVDPRNQRDYCFMVSDKALAIGGAVLEAMLAFQVKTKKE